MSVDDLALQQVAMTRPEYERLLDLLDREPTEVELGMVGALWSEHCGYKHSRPLFKHFPSTGEYVLTKAGEENAGAIDLGDGWVAVFKMESHNHPSALEPYEGAATGVGGILRDIFAMGMRPVALLDSLRFGPLSDQRNRRLFRGVVEGIGGYGNCVGVPTVGGEVQMHPSYSGNPLVNAMAIGIGRREHLLSASARGVGNPLVLVGADTGVDGIHGATFASVELSEGSDAHRPAVQVGNPFLEKLLMEACCELAEQHKDWIEGLQDLGAAGLTSSAVEAASRAGTGIDIDVALVPRRAQHMTPYQVMLSESQERMLVIPKKEHLEDVLAHFRRWEIRADVIGTVTDDQMATIRDGDQVVARMPVGVLVDPPQYPPEGVRPADLDALQAEDLAAQPDLDPSEAGAALLRLLATENIASRRWIYRQFDHQVQNNTVVRPGGDAALIRIKDSTKGVAASTDCNGRMLALDPRTGAAMAVAEACRNVVATGAQPAALTDCLNFGNPEKPEVAWQMEEAILGLSAAARVLETPVISGNASLYNEAPDGPILPTPSIGVVGLIEDASRALTIAPAAGDTVVLLGAQVAQPASTLAGSEYQWTTQGRIAGMPRLDLDHELRVQRFVLDAHGRGLLTAAHDLSDGGLAVALAEMCFAADAGIDASDIAEGERLDAALFGEAPSRFLVGTSNARVLLDLAAGHGIPAVAVGVVGGDRLRLGPIDVALEDAAREWSEGLDRMLAEI
ncbi:MAG: phosphoribosylformylglycinamidine synthase subunit PurL [Dehalococcoidia bacterium]|nr:phosphoribosylformylglycinamidine synthase subunit PurL [Dehalococcoidia bacterium]